MAPGGCRSLCFRLAYERRLVEDALRLDGDLLLDEEAAVFAAGRFAAPAFDEEGVVVRAADCFAPVLDVWDADLVLVEDAFAEAGFAVPRLAAVVEAPLFLVAVVEAPLFLVAVVEAPLFFEDAVLAPDDLDEALEDFFRVDCFGGANMPVAVSMGCTIAPPTLPSAVPIASLATVSAPLSFRLAMWSP